MYSRLTVNTRSRSPSPSATSAVMILVVDAMGRRLSAFEAKSVSPVSASIVTAADALSAEARGMSAAQMHTATHSLFTRTTPLRITQPTPRLL